MDLQATFQNLCDPAKLYFVISTVGLVLLLAQNLRKGTFHPMFILGNILSVVLWTWVLDQLCKINPNISWVFVLFPFVLTFILLGYVMYVGALIHKK